MDSDTVFFEKLFWKRVTAILLQQQFFEKENYRRLLFVQSAFVVVVVEVTGGCRCNRSTRRIYEWGKRRPSFHELELQHVLAPKTTTATGRYYEQRQRQR